MSHRWVIVPLFTLQLLRITPAVFGGHLLLLKHSTLRQIRYLTLLDEGMHVCLNGLARFSRRLLSAGKDDASTNII